MRNVGFVGLGAMGAAMARGLVEKQYRVTGYDLNPDAVKALAEAGGQAATSAAEAAKDADVLIVLVVNAEQAESVLFDAGALEALSPNAPAIVMSTCAPERIEALAKRCEEAGHPFVDAPISGGVVGVVDRTLTIMAAAPKPVFETVKPLLSNIGSNTYHIGEQPGQGSAMKTVNQLLAGVHIAAAAEGIAFAERAGIDPKLALEILSGSAASSWMLKNRGPRMAEASDEITSAVDIFVKDLGIVIDAGRAMKMGLPLAAATHQLFLSVSGAGHGLEDDSQVIKAYRAFKK